MVSKCDCRITLEELAEKAGFSSFAAVASQAARLEMDVAEDWAGRPSVPVADAGRLYAAVTGAREENSRENNERLRRENEETAAREAAENAIYRETFNRNREALVSEPKAAYLASEAVAEARRNGTLAKLVEAKMSGEIESFDDGVPVMKTGGPFSAIADRMFKPFQSGSLR